MKMTRNLTLMSLVLMLALSACNWPLNGGPVDVGYNSDPITAPIPTQSGLPEPTETIPTTDAPFLPDPCEFITPGHLDGMPSTVIELAQENTWFHRVFNTRLFNAANNWAGADSWFVSLALGPNSGGNWTSFTNPGQIIYRGTSTSIRWCLGVSTSSEWKSQFMGDTTTPAAINIRIAPNSVVTVVKADGTVVHQATSDMGDITVILPNDGIVTISVSFTTAAPTHESIIWWGPYDRSININTVDAR